MARQDLSTTAAFETAQPYDFRLEAQTEFETICDAVCAGLRAGSLPPDEAYWWTRILFEEAVARLAVLSLVSGRAVFTGQPDDAQPNDAQAA